MTHPKGLFLAHSAADDEESLTTRLLEGASSTRVERHDSTKTAKLFRVYFFLLHVVLLVLLMVMIQWAHPYWKANHELIEDSTWCMCPPERKTA